MDRDISFMYGFDLGACKWCTGGNQQTKNEEIIVEKKV